MKDTKQHFLASIYNSSSAKLLKLNGKIEDFSKEEKKKGGEEIPTLNQIWEPCDTEICL